MLNPGDVKWCTTPAANAEARKALRTPWCQGDVSGAVTTKGTTWTVVSTTQAPGTTQRSIIISRIHATMRMCATTPGFADGKITRPVSEPEGPSNPQTIVRTERATYGDLTGTPEVGARYIIR